VDRNDGGDMGQGPNGLPKHPIERHPCQPEGGARRTEAKLRQKLYRLFVGLCIGRLDIFVLDHHFFHHVALADSVDHVLAF